MDLFPESELTLTASTSRGLSSTIDNLRDRDKIVIRPRSRDPALKQGTSTRRALGFFNSSEEGGMSVAKEKKNTSPPRAPKGAPSTPPRGPRDKTATTSWVGQDVEMGSPVQSTQVKAATSTPEKPPFTPRVLTHRVPSSRYSGSVKSSICSHSPTSPASASRASHAAAYTQCPCAAREVDCRRCRVLKLADRFSGLVHERRENVQRASVSV